MALSVPIFLPALAVAVAVLLSLPSSGRTQLIPGDAGLHQPLPTKRSSFTGLKCRGVFDKFTFHELDAVCQECFGLYQEYELQGLCRYVTSHSG